jgi:Flp pilus assembly protein TadB
MTRKLISGLQGGNLQQTEDAVETYYVDMIASVLCVILITVVLCLVLVVSQFICRETSIHVVRQEYGEDSSNLTVYYEDADSNLQEIGLEVEAVQYRPEELEQEFLQGFQYLEELMPGENTSLDHVLYNLNLAETIPDSGLTVTWSSENYELISASGEVRNQELTEAQTVWITLTLSYYETTESRSYELTICPSQLSGEEEERRELQQALEQELQERSYEQEFDLPAYFHGVYLQSSTDGRNSWLVLLLLGIGCSVLFVVRKRTGLSEQIKNRRKLLMQDYPYLVNQILLYTSAGATVQSSFERVTRQLEKRKQTEKPLYQELVRFRHELYTGVSQEQAYVHFGRRTGILPYIKLSSLLTQQLRKGGGGISVQLEQAEQDAFEQRRERAKKAGEEAGTKLLFPMILLMIISMVLVMYPALAGFAGGGF